jgi:hypothetical protein
MVSAAVEIMTEAPDKAEFLHAEGGYLKLSSCLDTRITQFRA